MFVILIEGKVLDSMYFHSMKEAESRLKWKFQDRPLKRIGDNLFVCERFGTRIYIQQLFSHKETSKMLEKIFNHKSKK